MAQAAPVAARHQAEAPAASPAIQQASVTPAPTGGKRGSLEALVADLRAKGFPPVAVRAVVKAQIKAELASDYRAVCDALATAPYWKVNTGLSDPAIDRARRLLDREVDDRATQLLGLVENELSPELRAANRRMYGNLPPEKLTQVMRINADYADLAYQARVESQGITLPEDAAKMRNLSEEQRADIDRMLTPEERLDYYLHGSSTANRLRARLVSFEPTEAEFLAIFKVERALDVQFPSGSLFRGPASERAATAREAEAKIAEALGPERYAEYSRRRLIVIPTKK